MAKRTSTEKKTAAERTRRRWTFLRHRVFYVAFRPLFHLYLRTVYGYRTTRYADEDPKKPYLILSNHVGVMDPFMLALSFHQPVYYVASDHIFRLGAVSRLIRFLVAPIPIVKSQIDIQAIRDMLHIIREGGSIGLFPSGNRSFTGPEMPIPPATGKLVRRMGATVVLFRLDGGYLSKPRWARHRRKGRMYGEIVRVLEPEELLQMSPEEIHGLLCLHLRESADFSKAHPKFHGMRLAEHLERVLFACPACHSFSTLSSKNDLLACTCGFTLRYRPDGFLVPVAPGRDNADSDPLLPRVLLDHLDAGETLPVVDTFDRFQREWLKRKLSDPKANARFRFRPIFTDRNVRLSNVRRAHSIHSVCRCDMRLYSDRIEFVGRAKTGPAETRIFELKNLGDMTVHGPQTLQFHVQTGDAVYEVRSSRPYSAYKYTVAYGILRSIASATDSAP